MLGSTVPVSIQDSDPFPMLHPSLSCACGGQFRGKIEPGRAFEAAAINRGLLVLCWIGHNHRRQVSGIHIPVSNEILIWKASDSTG